MPNINITDSRKRDAVVRAENTGVNEEVRYIDSEGSVASSRKVLKATVAHDYDTLNKQFGDDPQKLGYALIEGDPEVDMERCGVYLWGVSKVYVTSDDGIVYRIEQTEKVMDVDGKVKERRPRRRAEANVDGEVPLTWTGKKIKKSDAIRRFVFASKLQVVHVNGLTYDFLYGMAKELDTEDSLMMVGGGSDGKDPLVFRRGSLPYRGFLEGRVDGERYILLLHLSNMELKIPESEKEAVEVSSKSDDGAKEKKDRPKDDAPEIKKTENETPEINKTKIDNTETETTEKVEVKSKKTLKVAESQQQVEPGEVSSEDLGIWLKSIRMGKYLKLFVENEIDVDVLTELTDDDLKDLDIPLGSRRRLLKAVVEADNLHAEVAMAVSNLSQASVGEKTGSKSVKNKKAKKKKAIKKKPTEKKAGKTSR